MSLVWFYIVLIVLVILFRILLSNVFFKKVKASGPMSVASVI